MQEIQPINVERVETHKAGREAIAKFFNVDNLEFIFSYKESNQYRTENGNIAIAAWTNYASGMNTAALVTFQVSGEFGETGYFTVTQRDWFSPFDSNDIRIALERLEIV